MCGNIILTGICAIDFSPWGCSLKNESSSSSSMVIRHMTVGGGGSDPPTRLFTTEKLIFSL